MAQSPSRLHEDRPRQLARLGASLFVETVSIIVEAFDKDLVTALTFLAISRQNLRQLTDGWAARGVGREPDRTRQPASTRALSATIGIPYETVRRHLRKLRQAGLCEVGPAGAVIPDAVYSTPILKGAADRTWRTTNHFVGEAARSGIIAPSVQIAPTAGARWQVCRIGVDYFLDGLALARRHLQLDTLDVLVMRAVWVGNARPWLADPDQRLAFGALADIPADAQRPPVSSYAAAKALSLPYETVRRAAERLSESGRLSKAPDGGLIVPASVSASPALLGLVSDYAAQTGLFLGRLAEIGVIPDAEPAERA
jgi:DNA-binding transcriptional ArsR family regulator